MGDDYWMSFKIGISETKRGLESQALEKQLGAGVQSGSKTGWSKDQLEATTTLRL